MKISKKEFDDLSQLASLSFDSDNENIVSDLEKILSRFESLSKIDTFNVEPTSHVTSLQNSMREDKTKTRSVFWDTELLVRARCNTRS